MANPAPKRRKKLFIAKIGHKPYSKSYLKKIWQGSEREFGMWGREHDDPDDFFKNVETSCGRIGHISGFQMDTIRKNYVGENKSREKCPKWLQDAILTMLMKQVERHRPGILRLDFYGELEDNAAGIERLPDLFVMTVEEFTKLWDRRRRLENAKERN